MPEPLIPFGFYEGVVADNADPERRGRVRCEVPEVGFVAEDNVLTGWAPIAQPVGGVFNRGDVAVPAVGARVLVGFTAGDPDRPVCLGTFPTYAGERSDSPRAARGEEEERIAAFKGKDAVRLANQTGEVAEPEDPYAAVYPNNRVFKSGAVLVEIDGTPGAERFHVFHLAGSFYEIHPDGTVVERSSQLRGADGQPVGSGGARWQIVEGDAVQHVGRNRVLLVHGGSFSIVEGDVEVEVQGDETREVSGEFWLRALRNLNLSTEQEMNLVSGVRVGIQAAQVRLGSGVRQGGVVTDATLSVLPGYGIPIPASRSVFAES